ncbi:hypothetical protein ONS95_008047 [Cadophora gregata]|uniref:uncharacterized protein n=1 Tax=Cadophora gregata TaxID=51156 RepID=UPI0026DACE64|nr:uncharacterized protein ONS95_008047 [Cadophora gregata]KAK0126448.1 hypothetical protein ONS95_008047 [Cadophora gregata]
MSIHAHAHAYAQLLPHIRWTLLSPTCLFRREGSGGDLRCGEKFQRAMKQPSPSFWAATSSHNGWMTNEMRVFNGQIARNTGLSLLDPNVSQKPTCLFPPVGSRPRAKLRDITFSRHKVVIETRVFRLSGWLPAGTKHPLLFLSSHWSNPVHALVSS